METVGKVFDVIGKLGILALIGGLFVSPAITAIGFFMMMWMVIEMLFFD